MVKLWMDRPPVFEIDEWASLLHPFTGPDFDQPKYASKRE